MELEQALGELEKVEEEIFRGKVINFRIAEHRSPFRGAGYDIHSIRKWVPGEPMNTIDYQLSLPTWPKTIVQVPRIETKSSPVILIADISPSAFVSIGEEASKFRLLVHIIGALGLAADHLKDPVGVLAITDQIEFYLRPKLGRNQIFYGLRLLLEKAEEFEKEKKRDTTKRSASPNQDSGINTALSFFAERFKRQAALVMVSDFTDFISGRVEMNFELVEMLSAKHNRNVIAVFLDEPQEFSWTSRWGLVRIRDIETGKSQTIRASRAAKIRQEFCERRETLRQKLQDCGVDSAVLSYGDHFNELAQFLSERKSTA